LIRVLIQTTSSLTRAGLESVCRQDPEIQLVRSSSDADVVVADELPDTSELLGSVPLVLISSTLPLDGLRFGARAVIPTDARPAQVVAAIRAAAVGLVVMAPDDLTNLPRPGTDRLAEPLTARELEVLDMMAEGVSNKIIAYRLSISEHTAKFHVNSIFAKLNVRSRTEAVTRGIRLGLVKL